MRIAITGTQNNGKSTLVNAFKQRWPMYSSPEKTYRDLVKEKNLTLNESGTLESQKIIRDFLVEQALENAGKQKTIHDRCVLDNVAYTLWMAEYNKLEGTESEINEFITTSILLTRESMKFYDIVFWLPLNSSIPIQESPNRSTDMKFREEIDNIFQGIFEHYKKNSGLLFEKENQPAFIVLDGEVHDKLDIISQYLNDDGDLIETTSSVLGDLENIYDELSLRTKL